MWMAETAVVLKTTARPLVGRRAVGRFDRSEFYILAVLGDLLLLLIANRPVAIFARTLKPCAMTSISTSILELAACLHLWLIMPADYLTQQVRTHPHPTHHATVAHGRLSLPSAVCN